MSELNNLQIKRVMFASVAGAKGVWNQIIVIKYRG